MLFTDINLVKQAHMKLSAYAGVALTRFQSEKLVESSVITFTSVFIEYGGFWGRIDDLFSDDDLFSQQCVLDRFLECCEAFKDSVDDQN